MTEKATRKSDEIKAAGPPVGVAGALPPIGVPPGYVADRPANYVELDAPGTPARYYEGDDLLPANLPPLQIRELQQRMVAAGLIPRGTEFRDGYWDPVSLAAYRQLLTEANGSGLTAEQQLRVRMNTTVTNRPQFQAPAHLKPDPATLRENVRTLMSSVMGQDREPTAEELDHLVGVLQSYDSSAQANAQAAARAEFDAQQTAAETGVYTPPEVQQVDTAARFSEYFRQRYRPEIERREGIADLAAGRELLGSSIFAIDQMIGA